MEATTATGNEYWSARAKDGLAWILVEVGHFASGEFVDATEVFEETLPISKTGGLEGQEAMCIRVWPGSGGHGRYEEAIRFAHEAIEMMSANGAEDLIQLPLIQLAMVYRDSGNFEKSRPYFEEAINASDRAQDPYSQITAALGYGCLLQYTGEKDAARELWLAVQPLIAEIAISLAWGTKQIAVSRRLPRIEATRGSVPSLGALPAIWQPHRRHFAVLQNQQMLLRAQIDQVSQLQDALHFLTTAVASEDAIFVFGLPKHQLDRYDLVVQFINTAAANMIQRTPVEVMKTLSRVLAIRQHRKTAGTSSQVFADGQPRTLDPVRLDFPGCEEPDALGKDDHRETVCPGRLAMSPNAKRWSENSAGQRTAGRVRSREVGDTGHRRPRPPLSHHNIYWIYHESPEQEPKPRSYST
ncbi:MAG: tetratricopeptide repeat protein [Aquabacterium sp.]